MALTIGARLRRPWRGLAVFLLLCAAFPGKAHEIRPALLELTQLTKTEWRLRFRQPQMMGRVLPLVPQSNCAQEERGVTLAVDAVETEYRLRCPEGQSCGWPRAAPRTSWRRGIARAYRRL